VALEAGDDSTSDRVAAGSDEPCEQASEFLELLGPLRAAWDSSPALVSVVRGPDHRLVYQNAASVRHFGIRDLGVALPDAFPEMPDGSMTVLDGVLATGEPVSMQRRNIGMRNPDGDEILLHYVVAPLGSGPPYDGLVMTCVDVTAQVKAESAAERAELLSRVSQQMSTATDPESALAVLTRELVPAVADVAAVFITPPGRRDRQGDSPPAAITISDELLAAAGPPPPPARRNDPSRWDAALAAGRLVLITPEEVSAGAAIESPMTGWLTATRTRNFAVVPLAVAGDLSGAVVLLAAGDRAPFGPADEPFLGDVAARASSAVAQHRTAAGQQELVLQLQRSLLPAAPPHLPGIAVAARYVAGSADVEVGGDWWDVHHLGAGRVGIGVGDVSGRGVPAAVVMGQARAGMRAAAHADLPPIDVLTVLDAQVSELVRIDDTDPYRLPPRFATATYAVIDPFDDTLRVATAGHPPLLVRHPSGRVDQVAPSPGPPLGLGGSRYDDLVVPFPAGSILAAYTDGLVESHTRDIESGIEELAAALAAFDPDTSLEEMADRLLEMADRSDDTALVLLHYLWTGSQAIRVRHHLMGLEDVPVARRALTEAVRTAAPEMEDAVAAVSAELLANAMLHAGPPARMRAAVSRERVLVEVADTSAMRPRQRVAASGDESGRGLSIVATFAHTWGFRVTRDGKSTWAELLPEA
jgi:serine phosphatase RsbU (regulator of sigma subunit)